MSKHGLFTQFAKPVVVGGVGGSGTRLVAECLKRAGFYIGSDLNEAYDNLWFTLLFKRIEILSVSEDEFDSLVDILFKAMIGDKSYTSQQNDLINALVSENRMQHPVHWYRRRADTLLADKPGNKNAGKWGWKEPNSHIVLKRLADRIEGMKYIHVVRNGLDMAHSENQRQLKLWGKYFLDEEFDINPYYSLKYWCAVHKRVISIGASMNGNFFFLNYDNFCVNPENGISQLLNFIGEDSASLMPQLLPLVSRPESIGRFREYGTDIFAAEDVAYVKSLGFDIDDG